MHLNFEWKARVTNLEEKEQRLLSHNPLFIGEDEQVDTYFYTAHGRLKLREGVIEHALIHYLRSNTAGAKQSDVILYAHEPRAQLKEALTAALGIKAVVKKRRRIYFVENVKFHFDVVEGLGTFIEVEAIDKAGNIGLNILKEQCTFWANELHISEQQYIALSYSDLLLSGEKNE